MSKENLLYSIIGLLFGFIVGYIYTQTYNARALAPTIAAQTQGATDAPSAEEQQQIQQAREQAQAEPQNFDAQMKAAETLYRARLFDEAIEILIRANQLQPERVEPMIALGNSFFDAGMTAVENGKYETGRFENAEKWYGEALKKDEKSVPVRTDYGLTFVFRQPPDYDRGIAEFNKSLALDPKHEQTLQNMVFAQTQKGDAAKAQEFLAKLEKINPSNRALSTLRENLTKLKDKK